MEWLRLAHALELSGRELQGVGGEQESVETSETPNKRERLGEKMEKTGHSRDKVRRVRLCLVVPTTSHPPET